MIVPQASREWYEKKLRLENQDVNAGVLMYQYLQTFPSSNNEVLERKNGIRPSVVGKLLQSVRKELNLPLDQLAIHLKIPVAELIKIEFDPDYHPDSITLLMIQGWLLDQIDCMKLVSKGDPQSIHS